MHRRLIAARGDVVYSAVEQRLDPHKTGIGMTQDGWTAITDGTGDGRVSTDFLVRRRERLTLGVSDVDGHILGIGAVEVRVVPGDGEAHRLVPRTRPYE